MQCASLLQVWLARVWVPIDVQRVLSCSCTLTRYRFQGMLPGVKSFATIFVLLFLSLPLAHAQMSGDVQKRQSLTEVLMNGRIFPPRHILLRIGPAEEINRILASVAIDRNERPQLRLNAIRAMEHFPTRRTEEVLMSLLYARNQMPAFKRTCLRALARGFGARMYFEVLPFLRDGNVRVREGAALAMGEIDDERIRGILANHLVHEQTLDVRIAIERAIRMVDERARVARQRERESPPQPIH